VLTFGSNSSSQLGRNATVSSRKVSISLLYNEKITNVGAIRSISYIVTNMSIYVAGNCELGLCGSVTGLKSFFTRLTLPSTLIIRKVLFFDSNLVVVGADGLYYAVGNNDNGQLCRYQSYSDNYLEYSSQFIAISNASDIVDM